MATMAVTTAAIATLSTSTDRSAAGRDGAAGRAGDAAGAADGGAAAGARFVADGGVAGSAADEEVVSGLGAGVAGAAAFVGVAGAGVLAAAASGSLDVDWLAAGLAAGLAVGVGGGAINCICAVTSSDRSSAVRASTPCASSASAFSRSTVSLCALQSGHDQSTDFFAIDILTSSVASTDPIAPWAGEGKNPMIAMRAVRIDHEGCHDSGWYDEMVKQILRPTSNLPLGVKK